MPKLIAVVYKNSALENYSTKQIRRHREINPYLSAQMVQAHEEHAASLDALHRIVDTLQLKTEFFERDRLRQNLDNFALVISLGGDGTFIHASHYIKNVSSNQTLLVGINSSPKHSVGHYCRFHLLAKKNENQFAAMLAAFFNEKNPSWKENFLLRMRVTVQGQEVAYPILNDVLFCEKEAGATSRYTLKLKAREHFQRSSGIWITTPTGSTAAYASAGGAPFTQKEIRFIVRELYSDNQRRKMTSGRIRQGENLTIVNSMMSGLLYLDGAHYKIPMALGEHVVVSHHTHALRAVY